MEFEGTVYKVLPQVKGTSQRGEWTKQEVVFEQHDEYNRKLCVSFWGDKALDAAALKPGDRVSVAANVESREYNGRWYTEARAWKLVRMDDTKSIPAEEPMPAFPDDAPLSGADDDIPF